MAPSTDTFNSDRPDQMSSPEKESNQNMSKNLISGRETELINRRRSRKSTMIERVEGNQKDGIEEENWSETEMDRGEDQEFCSFNSENNLEN